MTNIKTSSVLKLFFFVLLLMLPLLTGCGGVSLPNELRDYLNDPNYPQDFWTTATPEDVGLDSAVLNSCANTQTAYGIHSILVIRNDKLVFERYGLDEQNGNRQFTPDEAVVLHSVTKSFTSALIGIAINDGYINSLQDHAVSYFAGTTIPNMSAAKGRMTIEDVITMRSGLQWDEGPTEWTALAGAHDAGLYTLSQPMATEPGTVWEYNTGNSAILASIIYRATGKIPENYAREKLFGPLGITDFHWTTDQGGINLGGSELYLRPRDMAKFGYLYLKHGVWNGVQIIPSSWVDVSTQQHTETGSYYTGYGYHWWRYPNNGYTALGRFSQYIIIFPDQNMVITFTAYLEDANVIDTIVQNILRSIH